MNIGAQMTGRDIWPYKSFTREWGMASSRKKVTGELEHRDLNTVGGCAYNYLPTVR
jgi:hypothetical protein